MDLSQCFPYIIVILTDKFSERISSTTNSSVCVSPVNCLYLMSPIIQALFLMTHLFITVNLHEQSPAQYSNRYCKSDLGLNKIIDFKISSGLGRLEVCLDRVLYVHNL